MATNDTERRPPMTTVTPARSPGLSLVMPCYNEEAIVAQTIKRVLSAFQRAEIALELVAVDNGSLDRTGALIRELMEAHPNVRLHRVEQNVGYGNGVLAGLPLCTAPWVGVIPADGQVDAEDAVRLFEDAVASGEVVIAKARRRFRMDGMARKLVSIGYNLFFRMLWPGVESLDINGLPKIMPREVVQRMALTSRQWFLDPEIMIKAHYLGVRVLEYNVFARMRGSGLSHVRAITCWEFVKSLLRYRFSSELSRWRKAQEASPRLGLTTHNGAD
ncbi:MAG: Undecaprenyl-phosphate 4-deoxy-4-formamido-L-arabinose transferase [Gemmatimonadaceae bacterium]|nr:Undecaprenyl-phosphate 4-deoxy-4-formamido-L-arabinose transferase [Gemmatimonadaceae bacterium]